MDTQLVGGPLMDAADPTHQVQPDRCVVCSTAADLMRTHLDGPAGVICHRDYNAAMRLSGPARVSAVLVCTRCGAYGVVAVWPLRSMSHITEPAIRLCRPHLAEAVAALVAEHATTTQETRP